MSSAVARGLLIDKLNGCVGRVPISFYHSSNSRNLFLSPGNLKRIYLFIFYDRLFVNMAHVQRPGNQSNQNDHEKAVPTCHLLPLSNKDKFDPQQHYVNVYTAYVFFMLVYPTNPQKKRFLMNTLWTGRMAFTKCRHRWKPCRSGRRKYTFIIGTCNHFTNV